MLARNSSQRILDYLQHQLPEYPFDPDLERGGLIGHALSSRLRQTEIRICFMQSELWKLALGLGACILLGTKDFPERFLRNA